MRVQTYGNLVVTFAATIPLWLNDISSPFWWAALIVLLASTVTLIISIDKLITSSKDQPTKAFDVRLLDELRDLLNQGNVILPLRNSDFLAGVPIEARDAISNLAQYWSDDPHRHFQNKRLRKKQKKMIACASTFAARMGALTVPTGNEYCSTRPDYHRGSNDQSLLEKYRDEANELNRHARMFCELHDDMVSTGIKLYHN